MLSFRCLQRRHGNLWTRPATSNRSSWVASARCSFCTKSSTSFSSECCCCTLGDFVRFGAWRSLPRWSSCCRCDFKWWRYFCRRDRSYTGAAIRFITWSLAFARQTERRGFKWSNWPCGVGPTRKCWIGGLSTPKFLRAYIWVWRYGKVLQFMSWVLSARSTSLGTPFALSTAGWWSHLDARTALFAPWQLRSQLVGECGLWYRPFWSSPRSSLGGTRSNQRSSHWSALAWSSTGCSTSHQTLALQHSTFRWTHGSCLVCCLVCGSGSSSCGAIGACLSARLGRPSCQIHLACSPRGSLGGHWCTTGKGRWSYTRWSDPRCFDTGTCIRSRWYQRFVGVSPCQKLQVACQEPCAVCYEEMVVGEEIRRLPCLHNFHKACIDRWIKVKATCPLDNLNVRDLIAKQREGNSGSSQWWMSRPGLTGRITVQMALRKLASRLDMRDVPNAVSLLLLQKSTKLEESSRLATWCYLIAPGGTCYSHGTDGNQALWIGTRMDFHLGSFVFAPGDETTWEQRRLSGQCLVGKKHSPPPHVFHVFNGLVSGKTYRKP